jgi:hypothetical protein
MTSPLAFWFPRIEGETAVRVDTPLSAGTVTDTLRLRTCADKPVRLVASEWPIGLVESVDHRYSARNGLDKGRVLFVWSATPGAAEIPLACCCWHVHQGNWPLCVFDAGWSQAVNPQVGKGLVEQVLFGALRQLATDDHLRDTEIARPADLLAWRVDHQDGAGNLQARRARARQVATRAQQDFGFARVATGKRPSWARNGFYGERQF